MCGIAGAVGHLPDRLNQVRSVARSLVHRGPDEAGEYDDADCSLAVRRLSIIDVAGGHQPIHSESGDVVVACNGELYNFQTLRRRLEPLGHAFATRCDVEVAVHGYEAWGDDFLADVNGMFALAVWDRRRRRLLLARDRLGKKPLYYTLDAGGVWFASELRSLLGLAGRRWTVDREACRAFCMLGHMPGDRTPVAEIRRLPPGHLGVWEGGEFTLRRYWSPEAVPVPQGRRAAEAVLRDLLCESVGLRLISDVPVGVFLSGGLDSSTIVAVAAGEMGARIPTFTIGFPGYSDFDEAAHARRVARYFGCEHHEIPITAAEFQGVEELVWLLDEPLADPAALPTLALSRRARQLATVVLTGEGGDEVFGGYERYWLALRGSAIAARVPGFRSAARLGLALRGGRATDDSRASRMLRSAHSGDGDPLAWSRSLQHAPALAAAAGWSPADCALVPPLAARQDVDRVPQRRLAEVQSDDVTELLANALLTKVDRMTMAASVEARCPYLDHRVVAFGLGLPDRWKAGGLRSKPLLRALARELLPADIYSRRKHTFRVPVAEWLRGPLKGLLERVATSSTLSGFDIVGLDAVRRLIDAHLAGRADYSRVLWALVTLHLWLEGAVRRVVLEPGGDAAVAAPRLAEVADVPVAVSWDAVLARWARLGVAAALLLSLAAGYVAGRATMVSSRPSVPEVLIAPRNAEAVVEVVLASVLGR